ncbi:MAG: DUF2080 family transposase-associated protein [Nanoarchaeota archaeon]
MKQELIKQVVKVGNTAGVLVPREWLNGKAKIILLEESLNMEKIRTEIFNMLSEYLPEIKAIILAGSYARGEQDSESDVEVIAISENLNKKLENGKFTIIIIPENKLNEYLESNAMPLLPMLREGKVLLNETLVRNFTLKSINKKNIKWIAETTESALNIDKTFLDMDKEAEETECDDSVAYSLVLRLRGLLIIRACKKNKIFYNRELREIIKKITGNEVIYYQYRATKNDKNLPKKASVAQAIKIYEYTRKMLEEVKKYE